MPLLIFVAFIMSFNLSFAEDHKKNLSCLFEKPLIFGASISAGYNSFWDITNGAINNKVLKGPKFNHPEKHFGINPDPISRLAKQFNPQTKIINISEIAPVMPFGSIGYDQFLAFKEEQASQVESSTLLASIDSLYWPAAYNRCEEAVYRTKEIIEYARVNKKPLILATVPQEDPEQVMKIATFELTIAEREIHQEQWWAAEKSCVDRINNFLKDENHCNEKNGCFVIDLHHVVKDLEGKAHATDELGVEFEGKTFQYQDFRCDGIHLCHNTWKRQFMKSASPGTRYVMHLIEEKLTQSDIKFCNQ